MAVEQSEMESTPNFSEFLKWETIKGLVERKQLEALLDLDEHWMQEYLDIDVLKKIKGRISEKWQEGREKVKADIKVLLNKNNSRFVYHDPITTVTWIKIN